MKCGLSPTHKKHANCERALINCKVERSISELHYKRNETLSTATDMTAKLVLKQLKDVERFTSELHHCET